MVPLTEAITERLTQVSPVTPEQAARQRRYQQEEAARQAASASSLRRSRLTAQLGKRYDEELVRHLDYFKIYDPAQEKIIDKLVIFEAVELADSLKNGASVIFYGPVGTGKDHLLAWLLYRAVDQGARAAWINGQEIFGEFRDNIDTGQRDRELFESLVRPDVLGISDPIPPVGKPGNWDLGNLYRILDRRYRDLKPTWATLNALSLDDADAKLSAPVFDRLRHDASLFPCFWPSYRERVKA